MGKKRSGRTLPRGLTAERIVEGVEGPADVRVRLVRPEDAAAVHRLYTGDEAGSDGAAEAFGTHAGSMVLKALTLGVPLRNLLVDDSLSHGSIDLSGASVVLVAESSAGEILGSVMGAPPTPVLERLNAPDPMLAVLAAAEVARLSHLRVDPGARGRGVGTDLLRRTVQLYTRLQCRTVYGQIEEGENLEEYYRQRGFHVLPETSALLVTLKSGKQFEIYSYPGEQLFARGSGFAIMADRRPLELPSARQLHALGLGRV